MNANKLKSAVKTHSPLHAEGKTEQEVKAAIAADEKEYSEDEVNEIYTAITGDGGGTSGTGETEPEKPKLKGNHVVKTEFRDINDFSKIHRAGSDVSHFSNERLKTLVDLGHVEKK